LCIATLVNIEVIFANNIFMRLSSIVKFCCYVSVSVIHSHMMYSHT